MSANLTTTREGAMFASLRQPAWHSQGVVIENEVSGTEILSIANLDWECYKESLTTQVGGSIKDVEGYNSIIREAARGEDEPTIMGVVKSSYEPFQNKEMVQLLDSLAGDRDLTYETAGSLGIGDTVWVLCRIPDLTKAIGEDVTNSYFLVCNGHTGNRTLTVFPTTIRVVCNNTLNAADAEGKISKGYSIKHTKNMRELVDDMVKKYDQVIEDIEYTHRLNDELSRIQLTDDMIESYYSSLLDPSGELNSDIAFAQKLERIEDEETRQKLIKGRDRAKSRFENKKSALHTILASDTCQVEGTAGSAYSLLQSAVEWIDHERSTRVTKNSSGVESSRFESANFGAGLELKKEAFNSICSLAGIS